VEAEWLLAGKLIGRWWSKWSILIRVCAVSEQGIGHRAEVTSAANPRVRWLNSLRRRRVRDREGVTVVEGYDELLLALDSGVTPHTLVTCPELSTTAGHGLVDRVRALGSEHVTMSRSAFTKASYRESPDGWLAVVPTPGADLDTLGRLIDAPSHPGRPLLLLVCEAVEKPGNLGAMLRTAEAAGVDAVIAATPVADWANPNVVRASKGTVFAVPIAAASAEDVISWLRTREIHIVVATPETDVLVSHVDLTIPTAIVVGAEHAGVSALWFDESRVGPDAISAKLPMSGRVNSLNVATSAAIVVYEAVRQRRG
jgi:RNA methyltransferase, TrmH family